MTLADESDIMHYMHTQGYKPEILGNLDHLRNLSQYNYFAKYLKRNLGHPQCISSCHFTNTDLALDLVDTTAMFFQKKWSILNP